MILIALIGLMLGACSGREMVSGADDGVLSIVSTTTIIADVVSNVAGEEASVQSLLPPAPTRTASIPPRMRPA